MPTALILKKNACNLSWSQTGCIGLLAAWIVSGISLAWAGEGTSGSDFLNLLPGARSAGMADCYLAAGNDAESLFANPAGIVGLLNPQIGLSRLAWWDGIWYDAVWGVQPLGNLGSIGAAVAMLTIPPFDSTEDGSAGMEKAGSLLLSGSYAARLQKNLAVGGQVKYLQNTLGTYQAWGIAADAGAQYFLANDQLILAAGVMNLGSQTAYIENKDPLPFQAGVGAAYQFWPDEPSRLLLAAEGRVPAAGRPSLHMGAETWVQNIFALRLGLKGQQDAGDWLTVGAGVHWQSFHLDYALSPLGLLGMTHRFTLVYDFGSQRRLARPKLSVTINTKQFVLPNGEAGYGVNFIPKASAAAGLASWVLDIRDKRGRTVHHQQGGGLLPMAIEWNGCDASGSPVNMEETYAYRMVVKDREGYSASAGGEILPVSITRLPKLTAAPRDIFAGKVTFMPKDMNDMQEWNVDIVSNDGTILKKYQGVGMIPKDFSWDGKDDQNRQLAVKSGYHFVLRVKDKANNEMKSVAPIIVVDAGTKAWTKAGGDGLEEQVPFHFQPTDIKIKRWNFDVVDTSSGKIVRSFEGASPLPETLLWNSLDDQGKKVAMDKSYSYILRMQDQLGNSWQQAAAIEKTEIKVQTRTPAEIRVKIEQILFDFNKAELKPSMHQKLLKAAEMVRARKNGKTRLIIEGHTDELGSDAYNDELSFKRAGMVMRYLVEEEGMPSAIIEMKGYGKKQPVAAGSSPEILALNRRVEITLIFTP